MHILSKNRFAGNQKSFLGEGGVRGSEGVNGGGVGVLDTEGVNGGWCQGHRRSERGGVRGAEGVNGQRGASRAQKD